jgi:hypothetical protein
MPQASLAYTTDLQEAVDDMVGDDKLPSPDHRVALRSQSPNIDRILD